MKYVELKRKDILIIGAFFFLGIVLFSIGYYFYGNSIMPIEEYVWDWSLNLGTNALLENNMFWGVLFFLLVISMIIFKFTKNLFTEQEKILGIEDYTIYFLLLVNAVSFVYSGKFSNELLILFFASLIFNRLYKKDTIRDIITYILYSIFSCFIVYQFVKTEVRIDVVMIIVLCTYILMNKIIKESARDKIFKIFQCIYPLTLSIYAKDIYVYHEQIGRLANPISVNIFFALLIIVLICTAFLSVKKEIKKEGFYISITTCIVTSLIFSYTAVGRYIYDAHHLAEEVISFNQVYIYHKIPYINTFPVSGAFPILVGFIENTLGLGLAGANMAVSIFNILVSISIIFLLKSYIDNKNILILTILFPLTNSYVRPNLMLVYILLLFLPKLKARSGYWLETFVISSYVIVFFYPLFGVACVFSVLPIVCINIWNFFAKKEYIYYIKDKRFLSIMIIEIIIIVLLLPSSIGVIKHVVLYSDKSILANAWPSFGQDVPDIFLPYLKDWANVSFLRYPLWYSIRYMLPIIIIVAFFYLLLKNKENSEGSLLENYVDSGKWYFSAIVILIICCTLTTKRQDQYGLLTRTAHIIFPVISAIFYIIMKKFLKKNSYSIILLSLLYGIYLINMDINIHPLKGYFIKVQGVSDDYIYLSKDQSKDFENVGEGFSVPYVISGLYDVKKYSEDIRKVDNTVEFYGPNLAHIEGLKLNAFRQPSVVASSTYKTSKDIVENLNKRNVVVFDSYTNPTISHYIYKYLLTTPNYVYSSSHHAFIPKTLANKMGIVGDDKKYSFWEVTDVGNNAATAGKSFDYLKPNYDDTNLEFTYTEPTSYSEIINNDTKEVSNVSEINIDFNREITGLEGNYLYLDLQRDNGNISNLDSIEDKFMRHFTKEQINEKCTLNISWIGEEGRANFINCKMSDGRVFIPLEANTNWLLNSHKGVKVKVFGLDEGEKVHINSCEMMKSKDL